MTPLEICEQYAAGELTRAELIEKLSTYPYAPSDRTDGYDTLLVDPPGAWSELEQAIMRDLIDFDVYEDVLTAIRRVNNT
ncbi:MAG: hypothetical protein WBP12_03215 [Candidatus Saccharimonas sp.]